MIFLAKLTTYNRSMFKKILRGEKIRTFLDEYFHSITVILTEIIYHLRDHQLFQNFRNC